ncbi:hypothetical protein NDU88_002639 [Pleurodeles waltl]|uniref:Uncharacterized protein n=1 Tax=Pleurodeles waltl TaxID=8319 RepID=A0AAV7MN87_PLEWA|nr:hypothetical protein NDU88_002639 [Pleurodeles waltl]
MFTLNCRSKLPLHVEGKMLKNEGTESARCGARGEKASEQDEQRRFRKSLEHSPEEESCPELDRLEDACSDADQRPATPPLPMALPSASMGPSPSLGTHSGREPIYPHEDIRWGNKIDHYERSGISTSYACKCHSEAPSAKAGYINTTATEMHIHI